MPTKKKMPITIKAALITVIGGGIFALLVSILTPYIQEMLENKSSTPTSMTSSVDIKLIPIDGVYIVAKLDDQALSDDDVIPLGQIITVTFRVVNNGSSPATIKTLVIAARGPGASCQNDTSAKWSAPDNPFPTITNLTIQPGEEYEYQGSRALYVPGNYFLEPNVEDSNGHWGGIEPFSCISITTE